MRRLSLLAGQHQRGRFLTFHATVKASQWFKQKQVGAPTSPRQGHWFSTCPLTIKMLTASLHQKQTFPSASILALPTIWCQRFFKLWFGLVNNCSSCWSFPQMNFRRDSTTTPSQQETPSTAPACLQGKEGQQLQISCVHKSKASCSSWNATTKKCVWGCQQSGKKQQNVRQTSWMQITAAFALFYWNSTSVGCDPLM